MYRLEKVRNYPGKKASELGPNICTLIFSLLRAKLIVKGTVARGLCLKATNPSGGGICYHTPFRALPLRRVATEQYKETAVIGNAFKLFNVNLVSSMILQKKHQISKFISQDLQNCSIRKQKGNLGGYSQTGSFKRQCL